jgi:hypothetical protein
VAPASRRFGGHRCLQHCDRSLTTHCAHFCLVGCHALQSVRSQEASAGCTFITWTDRPTDRARNGAMKTCGGVDVWMHVFATSALVGGVWTPSVPGRFNPCAHWMDLSQSGRCGEVRILGPSGTPQVVKAEVRVAMCCVSRSDDRLSAAGPSDHPAGKQMPIAIWLGDPSCGPLRACAQHCQSHRIVSR